MRVMLNCKSTHLLLGVRHHNFSFMRTWQSKNLLELEQKTQSDLLMYAAAIKQSVFFIYCDIIVHTNVPVEMTRYGSSTCKWLTSICWL